MASLPLVLDLPPIADGSSSLHADPLVALIKKKLPKPNAGGGRSPSICRVYPDMRRVEQEAYEPKLVSIGPLHYGKVRLLPMEQVKLEYLRDLLNRHNENSLENYIAVIRSCLPAAMAQYSENIELSDDEFVEMLVVDGCFIIEYLAKRIFGTTRETAPLAGVRWGFSHLRRDLLLLENQIPFFVLTELFNKTTIPITGKRKEPLALMELVLLFLKIEKPPKVNLEPGKVLHLLHVYHLCLDPECVEEPHRRSCGQSAMLPLKKWIDLISMLFFAFLYLIFIWQWPPWFGATKKSKAPREIPCATELRAAGIQFKRKGVPRENIACYMKVSFREGILEIPFLSVDETTSARLRNLIALEQSCTIVGNHFTSYCVFMDNIINTAGDVAILRSRGILESKLGSDGEVADLFNNLCKGTHLKYEKHYNAKTFEQVVAFCEFAPHKWRAILVHNYFSNPWAIFSVFAGVLIALAAIQVHFTVFPRK
ncbi:unnamed protein product [Spirodela intermedia]|uniref:Uncharacterized protein n=1 Tax=Spirodela intermedia TaxID=51605 RepID=A0A7I8JX64_SPIIN|nr:unnamed protein product [Spirodela intermedia]